MSHRLLREMWKYNYEKNDYGRRLGYYKNYKKLKALQKMFRMFRLVYLNTLC